MICNTYRNRRRTGFNKILGPQRAGALVIFDGNIDEVGIWDRILTTDEITELYNAGAGLAYPFTVDSGTTTFSTTTSSFEDVVFGQGVIIFILSCMFGAYMVSIFRRRERKDKYNG